jgi:hypothetical protein
LKKAEGKRSLGRYGHRWEDNTKMDIKEMSTRVWTEIMRLRIRTSGKTL